MSAHSRYPWNFKEELASDFLIEEVVSCIEFHLDSGYCVPPVYGLFSIGDKLIFNIGTVIQKKGSKTTIEDFPYEGEPEAIANFKEATERILTKLVPILVKRGM